MEDKAKQAELKLKDYQRFIAALLILSCYLYMGAVINTYISPSSDGVILLYLSLTSVVSGIILYFQKYRIERELENER
ncbi:YrhC family protein [Virgibacillus sp. C22-A2]|uniref:YrhC family protein n=1 Tax=Virgibacillus tibetensis TaxID=3042313 RepID=A0ABU6KA96_9BACI|nr:YrhC family protein [Virgibacillus sp. C22-A2]